MKKTKKKSGKVKNFDRTAYRATSVKVIQAKRKREEAESGKRNDVIKLVDGTNRLRLYPAHPGGDSFWQTIGRHWLPKMGDKGKTYNIPVLNARFHAPEGANEEDIIEVYIDLLLDKAENEMNTKEAKAAKDRIFGTGNLGEIAIKLKKNNIAYADLITKSPTGTNEKKFGDFEFSKSIKVGLNDCALVEDEDEPVEFDPFSDPDDGKLALIKKDSKRGRKDPKKYYSVSAGKKDYPLLDEEMVKFSKVKPLKDRFSGVYGLKDFKTALEGLNVFDELFEYDIIELDEFVSAAKRLKANLKSVAKNSGQRAGKIVSVSKKKTGKESKGKSKKDMKVGPRYEEEETEEKKGKKGKKDKKDKKGKKEKKKTSKEEIRERLRGKSKGSSVVNKVKKKKKK